MNDQQFIVQKTSPNSHTHTYIPIHTFSKPINLLVQLTPRDAINEIWTLGSASVVSLPPCAPFFPSSMVFSLAGRYWRYNKKIYTTPTRQGLTQRNHYYNERDSDARWTLGVDSFIDCHNKLLISDKTGWWSGHSRDDTLLARWPSHHIIIKIWPIARDPRSFGLIAPASG